MPMQLQSVRLVITKPDGKQHAFNLEPGVYTVGSDEKNSIVLANPGVAWRQAIFTFQDKGSWVENVGAPTGLVLDGHRVTGRHAWRLGEIAQVGPFQIALAEIIAKPPPEPPREAAPAKLAPAAKPPAVPQTPPPAAVPSAPQGPVAVNISSNTDEARIQAIKRQTHSELIKRLDLKRMTASRVDEPELRASAQRVIAEIVKEARETLPSGLDAVKLAKDITDEALSLGPLEDLLAAPEVTEIMVNGCDNVFVERKGKLFKTDKRFLNDDSVKAIIERIVSPIGRRIDESQPYVDARLKDGSRVNAIIHPLSLIGPCLTIRKFSKEPFKVSDLIGFGSICQEIADFVQASVVMRRNIIVSGGTGSGKTTLLNVLSSYLPMDERIVTIEDAAELRLSQPHVIRLESRPPNIEGKGAVTIRDLVRNALRMRPDRIVVGECRGGEALDMLQAMNTGHEGSLTTVHANTPRDVISRLETMVLMSGMELPMKAIREQIGSAIHLIIHISRFSDGTRKVSKVTEVCGMEGDSITMQDIFIYNQRGVDEHGKVKGRYEPTGSVPTFVEEMAARGIQMNHRIFDPEEWNLR
ncbi:MAG: ATPase, T2SS/T4P/T4SS family [Kiritimatiellaeota bacterium]|nr:ATPase, T2SS/T4P/T4SS family [Kiritimatiellota bacterium]